MRQNQQKQPNMESYKTTTEMINKIKEGDCVGYIQLIEDNANK